MASTSPARSERDLVDAARCGDRLAFDRLVRRYQDYIYRLMVRAYWHPQDAEEIVSDAFLRAYQRLSQFEGRSSFVTWLGQIAANISRRRRDRRELVTVSLEAAELEPGPAAALADPSPSPESRALEADVRRVLREAIAGLPEPDRTVLRLRDIEELSTAEVSLRTGLTVPAVKARLHRARVRLRERLNGFFLPG